MNIFANTENQIGEATFSFGIKCCTIYREEIEPVECCADVVDVHASGLVDPTFRNSPNRVPRIPHLPPRSSKEPVTSGHIFHLKFIAKHKW